MRILGKFQVYTPSRDNAPELILSILDTEQNVRFFRNYEGIDWLDFKGETGTAVCVDDGGNVTSVSDDITMLNPDNMQVLVLNEGDIVPELGWIYKDDVFMPPPKFELPLGTITKRQFKLELIEQEKDDDLEAIITAMPTKEQKLICAELDANEYHRDSPLVEQIGTALGFSGSQIDQFWKRAAER